jgi:hypothetical protein
LTVGQGEEFVAMPYQVSESHPLNRLFHGLTEHTFQTELGIADVRLVGYVADLLSRFVPSEGVWKLRDRQGRRLAELAAMIQEAESAGDVRRAECLRHVGDFTLFWTGVFPEAFDSARARVMSESLLDFQRQGKRSYLLASTICHSNDASTLRRLSCEFELCAFGLTRVRREWERLEPPDGCEGRPLLIA